MASLDCTNFTNFTKFHIWKVYSFHEQTRWVYLIFLLTGLINSLLYLRPSSRRVRTQLAKLQNCPLSTKKGKKNDISKKRGAPTRDAIAVISMKNKTEKPFSPYGCAQSDYSFRTDFKYVINIQFDTKIIIPNLTIFWLFSAICTGFIHFEQV